MEVACIVAATDWLSDARFAGGIAAGLIVLLLLLSLARSRRQRVHAPRAHTREQLSREREQRELHQDIEEVVKHLEQVARQINSQLDARFERLDEVLRQADERVARLERLVRRADGQPTLDVTVDDDVAPPRESLPASQIRQRRVYELADAGRPPVEIAQELGQTTGEIELILALRRKAS